MEHVEKEPKRNYNYERFEEIFEKLGQDPGDVKDAIARLNTAEKNLNTQLKRDENEHGIEEATNTLQEAQQELKQMLTALAAVDADPKPRAGKVRTVLQKLDNLCTITGDASLKLQVKKFEVEARLGSPDSKGMKRLGDLCLKALISVAKFFTDLAVKVKAYAHNVGHVDPNERNEGGKKGYREEVNESIKSKFRPNKK